MTRYYTAVATYGGYEHPELHRCAGEFADGIFQRKVFYYGKAFHIFNPDDVDGSEIAIIPWHPGPDDSGRPDIKVCTIGTRRSAQSGNLVLTPAFFYVGGGGQRCATVATNYAVAEPVTYEQYQQGRR